KEMNKMNRNSKTEEPADREEQAKTEPAETEPAERQEARTEMQEDFKKLLAPLGYTALVITLLFAASFFIASARLLDRILFFAALFFYFILPGYCIMLHVKKLSGLERLTIGIPVGVAALNLVMYLLNVLLGIPITAATVILIIAGISVTCLLLSQRAQTT
ncbi:hypothetical protein COY95_05225, partial [Candidatus Woesearchaeota archaeon CG_4_10_14_0_8_um_filter_47_5]